MAWKDSFNNLASKTKDLTEITRINLRSALMNPKSERVMRSWDSM